MEYCVAIGRCTDAVGSAASQFSKRSMTKGDLGGYQES